MRKTRKDEKGIEELKIKQSNKMSSIDNIGAARQSVRFIDSQQHL